MSDKTTWAMYPLDTMIEELSKLLNVPVLNVTTIGLVFLIRDRLDQEQWTVDRGTITSRNRRTRMPGFSGDGFDEHLQKALEAVGVAIERDEHHREDYYAVEYQVVDSQGNDLT